MLLHPPNDVRTKSYGEKRFDKAAPTPWNSLPLSLRNVNSLDVFKRELKTHFFKIAFKNFLDSIRNHKIQIKSFRKEHYQLKILNTLENY
jgi:hypothetical protein